MMIKEIRIMDTQDRDYKVFSVEEDNVFPMYACGITPQSHPHIGHARVAVLFDTFARLLSKMGFHVKYVSNFTDVDDKILAKAKEEGVDPLVIAERYEREYYRAMDALNVRGPMIYARVSQHIEDIIIAVETLLKKGYAYEAPDGVYFSVEKFDGYGKLSHRNIEEMVAGARVEVNPNKKNPLDFALWKLVEENEFGWRSPWGKGRPGWHIECSVMSVRYAGCPLKVHGGGEDLIFPHHENEIAQSEALHGSRFVLAWMHVGMLSIKGEKMSKSLGNIFALKDAIKVFDPLALRLFLLSTYYRSPLDYTPQSVQSYESAIKRIKRAKDIVMNNENADISSSAFREYYEAFYRALGNDFNTAEALGHLFKFVNDVISAGGSSQEIKDMFMEMLEVLGIENIENVKSGGADVFVEYLIDLRSRFRKEKKYDLADEIRDYLTANGVIVEDTPKGTKWWWQ